MLRDIRDIAQEVLNKLVGKVNRKGYKISKLDILKGLDIEVTRNRKVVFSYKFNGKDERLSFKSLDHNYNSFSNIAIDEYYREIDLIDLLEEAQGFIDLI